MSFVTSSLPISTMQVGNGTADNATPSKLSGVSNAKIYFGVEIYLISGDDLLIDISTPTSGGSFLLKEGQSCEIPIDNPMVLNLLSTGATGSAYSWKAI